jgi:hypothetical protein
MGVLDIGADYGAYTVAMARAIGPTGRLVAFEPNANVAAYLRQTIDGNKLGHVTLRQTALGAKPDTEKASAGMLDRESEACGLGDIDFVRLDAERAALDIVAGGARLFTTRSPLVMFTARQGEDINTALLNAWRDRGYGLYRLIGPDTLLVPIGPAGVPTDSFEINLFACKPDRAANLEEAGLLATEGREPQGIVAGSGFSFWRQHVFATAFDRGAVSADLAMVRPLDLYAFWRDGTRPPPQRYAALTEAIGLLWRIVQSAEGRGTAHTATLARFLYEAGQRETALDQIEKMMNNERGKLPEGPFWPVTPRYDTLRPGADPGTWFTASLIEGFERLRAHSGYFAPQLPVDRLAWLSQTPFASAEMERRRVLLANRFGVHKATVPAPLVTRDAPDNLNFDLWAALQGK